MEMPEHTFPVPEPETSKLDGVTEELRRRPAIAKVKDFARANPWPWVVLGLTLGIFAGKLLR